VTSTRERQQRAAARARLARQMAERQAAAKKRRQRTTIIGAAAAALVVIAGGFWVVTAVSGDDEESPAASATADPGADADPLAPIEAGICSWLPEDPSRPGYEALTDVGYPPEVAEPAEGTATMTMETNLGAIEVEIDVARVPCTYASFQHLASAAFYDGSTCHRLTTEGIFVLQCGDPTGTGTGGPTYKLAEENLPADQSPPYPAGTLAMAKTQAPSSTGSQFFIVYDDTELPPDYTVVGKVTKGLEIVQDVAAEGASDPEGNPAGDGAPNTEVVIETLRVSEPA
jgi:peptidyl-prolyl cis-trans isomerase B (cyclophilin B)